MKKLLLSYLIISIFNIEIFAQESLTTKEHLNIHNWNNNRSIKFKNRTNKENLAKIKKEEAIHIAEHITDQKVLNIKLTHQNNTLYYKILTKEYQININALNGKILKKEKR